MKHFKKLFVLGGMSLTAFLLSGCSGLASTLGIVQSNPLSIAWESSSQISAAKISGDLLMGDFCKSEPENTYYLEDAGTEARTGYQKNTFRTCNTFEDFNSDAATMDCPAEISIHTDETAGKNAKRSLSYEDGMDVALFYGNGWEFSLRPHDLFYEDSSKSVAECADLVKSISAAVGGSITRYGDYANSEEMGSVDEPSTPLVNTVQVPNFIGVIDGVAKNWLFTNGYEFSFEVKSTGFNPKLSCMMSGQNEIIKQEPSAGTQVNNDYSTRVYVYVDCEN